MGDLVILRHGESIWNLEKRFCGWVDVPLSENGKEEALDAGKKLSRWNFDAAFTSTLSRAQETLQNVLDNNEVLRGYRFSHINTWYNHFSLQESDEEIIKVNVDEALNERFYGDLQGKYKDEMKNLHGEDLVHQWRRSFDVAPPGGEALKNTYDRTVPYFQKNVEPLLKDEKSVLIVAHGNSLRAIVKYLEELSDEEISQVELKTGTPIHYQFDSYMEVLYKEELK